MLQFHQNAPGHTKGDRLIIGEGVKPPTELVNRFEVYHPVSLPWPWATACGSPPAARRKTASIGLPTARCMPSKVHQTRRHRSQRWLGHRPGLRALDARLCRDQPCQPGRNGRSRLRRLVEPVVPRNDRPYGLRRPDARQGTSTGFHRRPR